MKKKYFACNMEILALDETDVVRTSGTQDEANAMDDTAIDIFTVGLNVGD